MGAALRAALRLRRLSCGRGQEIEVAEAVIQEIYDLLPFYAPESGPVRC
jgi:hypothetical protein